MHPTKTVLVFSLIILSASLNMSTRASADPTYEVIATKANLRLKPEGELLGAVYRGALLTVSKEKDGWALAVFRMWLWKPSTDRLLFAGWDGPLARHVSATKESLRVAPHGKSIGHILRGNMVVPTETKGKWIQVAFQGWIWKKLTNIPPSKDPSNHQSVANTPFTVKSWKWSYDAGLRYLIIQGTVQNNSDRTHESVEIHITAKDRSAKLIGVASTYARPSTVPSGEISIFTAYISDVPQPTGLEISYRFSFR